MAANVIVCQICGNPMPAAPVWSAEYRKLKEGKHVIWICNTCQGRVRGEALDHTGAKKAPTP